MPQRVLLMISSMRGGGSEQQTLLLLQHLDRSKFRPHLYLTERAGDLLEKVPDDVIVHAYNDVPQPKRVYFPGRALHQQSVYLDNLLRREKIDVIYDRTFHMTMIAGPAGRRCHVPRVSTIVSPPELAVPLVENRFIWLKRKRLARAYRQSHRVIAVSQQAADSAERFYRLPSGSTEIIRNPVNCQRIQELAQQATPSRDQRLTLVCVGRMTPEKGHSDLIAAIARCQVDWPTSQAPIRLWMIGDGPLRNELESLGANQSVGLHSIEFLGKQANPAPYIKAADALVLPSHFEGMPNVVLEAMALGTPVIATRAGGTLELQREEPTMLWAQPGDPESLARAIRELATDVEGASRRADNAIRMIDQHHNLQRCVGRIEKQLLQAAEHPRRR